MADYTPTGITTAGNSNLSTGVRTSAANITPSFTSVTRASSLTENNNTYTLTDSVTTNPGFLTGRRPSFGLLFPRGNYNR